MGKGGNEQEKKGRVREGSKGERYREKYYVRTHFNGSVNIRHREAVLF